MSIALSQGYDVKNVDIRRPQFPQHEAYWSNIDVRSGRQLRDAIVAFRPERILHLASDTDVNLRRIDDYKTTIEGTKNVVEAAKQLPNLECFVHISTQYVVKPGVRPLSDKWLQPYTLYGEAKAETERIIWGNEIRAPWVILRPSIIWGPRHPSFANAIWKYIANGRYRHPGAGMPIVRCYGYVKNTADQMMAFVNLANESSTRRVYYLGDECMNYDRWADAFAERLTGRPARRMSRRLLFMLGVAGQGAKTVGARVPFDMGRYFRMTTNAEVDLAPTFELVGSPKIPFEQGLEDTIEWLVATYPDRYHRAKIADE